MGGAGETWLGSPGAAGEGGPCLVSPAENVRELLELFPISASGPLGVGVRSGRGSGAPTSKPAGRHGSGPRKGPYSGRTPHSPSVLPLCGACERPRQLRCM